MQNKKPQIQTKTIFLGYVYRNRKRVGKDAIRINLRYRNRKVTNLVSHRDGRIASAQAQFDTDTDT